MKTKITYTLDEQELYRQLLELNYSQPYITLNDITKATRLVRPKLMPLLDALETKGKLLVGSEEVLGSLIRTHTPIVKGNNAYGYPSDEFKFNDWMGFQI